MKGSAGGAVARRIDEWSRARGGWRGAALAEVRRGAWLRPVPPGASRQKEVRYLDIREDQPLDEAQFTAWVKQASQLPGWIR